MAEPAVSLYPAALDTNTSLFGDVVDLKQFTLDAGINASVTTISVAESIASINTPVYLLVGSEIIYAESKTGGDFSSCVRGARSTTAAAHSNGDALYAVISGNYFNQLKRAIIAVETELGTDPAGASTDLKTRLAAVTAAEFGRLVGVTSAIQTQLDAKAPSASPTFTGTVILPKTLEIQDTSANHQYVLAVSELTADRTVTLPLLTGSDEFVFAAHTKTLTNKRITRRATTEASSATPTINTDNSDAHQITALAAAITSFTTNLSGTPTDGQELDIEILDNGTARAITWGASFASGPATLPTTTILSKWLYTKLRWSSSRSKWICMATGSEV